MIKNLSYIAIFIGVIFGAIGLTNTYFNGQIGSGENKLNAGTLEINLKDAFGAETAFQLNVGPMEPYKKEKSYAKIKNSGSLPLLWTVDFNKISEQSLIENKYLSDILQGEIGVERTLLYYLTKAKKAENNEEYQNALDNFVKKVKFLEQAGLMNEETKENLIIKSQMIR
jgi:hypothetical protein